ncbi:MAG: F0F1 ATP synthase subunit A [Eubacteriaceae bacterium]|nr:F0F1 ATP synthase subunit A [Eubacteriaceae bacterium]
MELGTKKIIGIGNFYITETVIWSLIISVIMIVFALLATRKMQKVPKGLQAYAEWIVDFIYNWVGQVMGSDKLKFAPYIGTLFIFLLLGNLIGLFDIRPITTNLNTPFALATITFVMIHYNAVKTRRLGGYIKHLSEPNFLMLPINLLSELSFPLSLSFRLFGNILGGVVIMKLLYMALEKLSALLTGSIPIFIIAIPLPLNFFFDIFESVLQAYVFTMLTMAFIANAMKPKEE